MLHQSLHYRSCDLLIHDEGPLAAANRDIFLVADCSLGEYRSSDTSSEKVSRSHVPQLVVPSSHCGLAVNLDVFSTGTTKARVIGLV